MLTPPPLDSADGDAADDADAERRVDGLLDVRLDDRVDQVIRQDVTTSGP
jgi:hypothetical protein